MKRTFNLIQPLLIIILLSNPVNAETYHLDLDKSIEIARSKSSRMLLLEQDLRIAEYNLKAATSKFKTHIDLNFVLPQYTETIRQFEDSTGISFYPVKRMQYEGNISVNQPLPTDGYVYMRSGLSNYDDFFTDNRSTYLNTRFGFVQPLDAFYGYNSIKASFKQAELAYERSSKQLKREELNLVYNVSNAFYNMLSLQKSTKLALIDLERLTEAKSIYKNKYEAGLIREVDALQKEVDLAASQNNYEMA